LLNIVKSNKMENLMHALKAVLKHVPDNPMMPESICIQSRGMKQWIAAQAAQNFGVCVNMRFLFPRQMIDQILTDFTSPQNQCKEKVQEPEDSLNPENSLNPEDSLNQDILFWSVMQLINENKSENSLADILNYIGGDEAGQRVYQLSMKIAKIFDDYQVYRPYMLMEWQGQKSHGNLKDSDARWQAWLWNAIAAEKPQNHIAYRASHFLKTFDIKNIHKEHLPQRISFFGISAIPKIFLQVFEKTSQIMDVNLFLLTPSNQFFFDIKSEKQIEKISLNQGIAAKDSQQLYYETTNPLLSSLGTAGKNFQSLLESFNYHEPFEDLFEDPLQESSSMLYCLQSDILNLVHRRQGKDNTPLNIESSDTSVSIHACHSPMRETQVLKDLLLNEFEKDPDLAPHDIIVMMPDIEAYAPFIESVFSLENSLPFAISDRKKRSDSEPIEAFLKILSLKNSRFERYEVLDLLLSESIAGKFNISFDEITMIEKMVKDAKILWGKDKNHRKSFDLPPFKENTWQFGLQRLFMGMAMPGNYDGLIKDILPCNSFEGLELKVLGKFATFCNNLFSGLETLAGKKSIKQWCIVLQSLCTSLIERNFQNKEDFTFLMQTIDQLRDDVQKSGFDGTISFDIIFSIIEQKLDQNISYGKFLTGNITFCNTMPMRSIPFKIVVLMGMDEKSFPGQPFTPGFDLIKKYPEPLDKIVREESRYLFLETLLCVRSKFIITYTGINIQDNSMIPCAGVVSELMDTMEQSFIFPKEYTYHFFHLLHPFNREYFIKNSGFFSFSKSSCNIAQALFQDKSEKHLFLQKNNEKGSKEPLSGITLSEIIYFFKNPVQWYMKQGLEITIPDLEEQTIEREPFAISGLDQYTMGSFLVDQYLKVPELKMAKKDFYPILKAQGSLPLGQKGRLEYENIKAIAAPVIEKAKIIAAKKQLPPISGEININNTVISANFSDITEDGVYILHYGKLNSARLISAWVRHLLLNLTLPDGYPKNTIVIGRDPAGKKDLLIYEFSSFESGKADRYFTDLVQIYIKGGEQIFYFFCETSWQFVQVLLKNNFDLDSNPEQNPDLGLISAALHNFKVQSTWYGNYYQAGEKDNRYISLCLENLDPFENVDTLLASGFVQNSIKVYKPMIANMAIIDN
jgi:exodeoxyribonuclease V gamma subunit